MRALDTPPLVISLIYVVSIGVPAYLATMIAEMMQLLTLTLAVLAAPTAFLMWWLYKLQRIALRALALRTGNPQESADPLPFLLATAASFALPIVLAWSNYSLRQATENNASLAVQITLVIAVLSAFVGIWRASSALVGFEERSTRVPNHRIIGTFLLIIYFPFGIWFLWPRIKGLVRETDAS